MSGAPKENGVPEGSSLPAPQNNQSIMGILGAIKAKANKRGRPKKVVEPNDETTSAKKERSPEETKGKGKRGRPVTEGKCLPDPKKKFRGHLLDVVTASGVADDRQQEPPLETQQPMGAKIGKSLLEDDTAADRSNVKVEQQDYDSLPLKEKRRIRMLFNRSLEADTRYDPAATRVKRAEKCPEWVVLQMQAEPHKRESWFRRWYDAGSWKGVTLQEEYITEHAKESGKVFAWMTLGQMAEHYKSQTVAEHIAAKKKKMIASHKVHPEVPELKEAMLFNIFFSEQESEVLRNKHIQVTRAETELDTDAADTHMANLAASWGHDVSPSGAMPRQHAEDTKNRDDGDVKAMTSRQETERGMPDEDAKQKKEEEKKKQDEDAKQKTKQEEDAKQKKEEDKEASEAAAKAKKALEREKKKSEDLRNPVKRAEKMLTVIGTFLGQIAVQQDLLQESTRFEDALRASYQAKFEKAVIDLKAARTHIEENLNKPAVLVEKLDDVNNSNEVLKRDLASFRVLHRTLYPKPRKDAAAAKAGAAQ